eukprot:2520848-Amphidinium_carterae.2
MKGSRVINAHWLEIVRPNFVENGISGRQGTVQSFLRIKGSGCSHCVFRGLQVLVDHIKRERGGLNSRSLRANREFKRRVSLEVGQRLPHCGSRLNTQEFPPHHLGSLSS